LSVLAVQAKFSINPVQDSKKLRQFKMNQSADKIQEIQSIENHIRNILLEKQSYDLELSETESALTEINSSGDEIFKVISQIMIKADKQKVIKDLEHKKKVLELHIKTLENQEQVLIKRSEKLRSSVLKEK